MSQILSQLAINLMNFYILTRIFTITQSTIAVAMMWIASSLPALLFGPFSGSIVDGLSKRKTMLVTNLLQAAVVFSLLFVHNLFPLYAVVFMYWLFDQFYLPSQQASIPKLVDKNHLASANGLFLLTQQGSLIVGFGLGGLILSLAGPAIAISLAAFGLLYAAWSVYGLPNDSPRQNIFEEDIFKFWRDLSHGYLYIKNHREVLLPLLTIVFVQIFTGIIMIILPSYTHDILNIDLNHASLILIVPGALGAFLVTYSLPRWLKNRRKKEIVQAGLVCGAISLLLMSGLGTIGWGRIILAIIISIGLGISISSITIPAQTLLQEKTPSWLRGSVYGQLSFMLIIATSLPMITAAIITDILGIAPLLALMAFILFSLFYILRKKGDYVLANGFRV